MAVIESIELMNEGEKVSLSKTSTTIKCDYQITVASGYMRPSTLATTTFAGKPTHGTDHHDIVTNAYLDSIDACEYITSDDNRHLYKYSVTFKTPEGSEQPPQSSSNPELELPDIEWGGSDTTETVYFDQEGTAIENRAGQAYQNMPQREAGDCVVTITRNEAANNAPYWNAYSYSINSDVWYGNEVLTCKIGRISAKRVYKNGLAYWRVSYPISFKADGWRTTLDNVGFCVIDTSTHQLKELIDKATNEKYTLPVKLNASGTAPLDNQTDDALTDTYKLYKETTWASISLPNPFN